MRPDSPNTPTVEHAPRSDAPTLQRRAFLLERIIHASSRNAFLIIIIVVFGIAGGIWALTKTPLDAIPDLSDVQVIVYTDWEGRSPDLVEDQITYPISTRFIAAPKVIWFSRPCGRPDHLPDFHAFHCCAEGEIRSRRVD